MQADSDTPPPDAETIYAEASSAGGEVDIEALCALHPASAAALRRLHAQHRRYAALVAPPPEDDPGSLFHRAQGVVELQPDQSRRFQAGETVGDFRLVRFLGRGGMGQVWEAEQSGLRRRVALKFLLGGRIDKRTVDYFLREARAGGRVQHPNVVGTIACGTTEGVEWIAQELVPGSRTLRDAIEDFRRDSSLPANYWRGVARLVEQVARGMQAAHEAGVVHRDLKPQNILVDDRDRPRIADFGLARVADETVLSKSGDVVGTWHYMSPEQASGRRGGVDHRSDVFSLGTVLYELLTLERPFNGDNEAMVAERIALWDPPDPRKLRSQCPRDLAVVALHALEKRPSARYQSMAEFAEDLRRFAADEPVRARPSSAWERSRKWARRNPAASMGMLVGAVALAAVSTLAVVAWLQAARAEQGEAEALRKSADVLSLSAQKDHDELVAEASTLWPAEPALLARCEDWIARARRLVDGAPADEARGLAARPSLADHKRNLAAVQARIEARRRSGASDEPEDAWWSQQLERLVASLELLQDEARGGLLSAGTSPATGWGMLRRREECRTLRERTLAGEAVRRRWDEALRAIAASPRYAGAAWPGGRLAPQLGLLPLEADPRSGLWEFLAVQTGAEPARGADGRFERDAAGQLRLTEECGAVLVLLPGGMFRMGAQKDDPSAPNHDPQAEPPEGPVHEVRLSPWFVGKHEWTQAQWLRFAGANPSTYQQQEYAKSLLHPVEAVSWHEVHGLLSRLALTLPTSAQWEQACRGGTDTPWSTGRERESLRGKANLADKTAADAGAAWTNIKDWPDLVDGWVVHAPVGTYPANPFGLHEVHGNVFEWCLDASVDYKAEPVVDPCGPVEGGKDRILRGASHSERAYGTRCSRYLYYAPDFRDSDVGFRAARRVDP